MAMAGMVIRGNMGPHRLETGQDTANGNFGRNTAYNAEWYARQNPSQAASFVQIYSPEGQPKVYDAIGYGEETVRIFDTDNSGELDSSEVRKALGADTQAALDLYRVQETQLVRSGQRAMPGTPFYDQQTHQMYQNAVQGAQSLDRLAANYIKVLDVDNSHTISGMEMGAYTMFQDDAANILPQTVQVLEQNQFLPAGTTDHVKGLVDQIRQLQPEHATLSQAADGKITPIDAQISELAVGQMPETTRMFLEELTNTLQLNQRQQQMKTAAGLPATPAPPKQPPQFSTPDSFSGTPTNTPGSHFNRLA